MKIQCFQDRAHRLHRTLTISIDHPAISRRSRRTNPRSDPRGDFWHNDVTCKCRHACEIFDDRVSDSGSLVTRKAYNIPDPHKYEGFISRRCGERGIMNLY